METSRSRKALINVVASFSNEIISVICGLILPRLILTAFGSAYNGVTQSITQFISCVSLMSSGIGGVTRAALYKPLAEKDNATISSIIVATERFLRKVAFIFAAVVIIFAAIYPTWIVKDFDWIFTFTLILIIASSTFIQYYFFLTYQMLLVADQKQWIISFAMSLSIVSNTIIAAILISVGSGIHMVKIGSTIAHAITPMVVVAYVHRHYRINHLETPNMTAISQRWDAVGHEVANFVNTNTDIIVITIFAGVKEVSVYTVYNYVVASIRKVVTNCITSFGAAFGNMYAKKQFELMHENLGIFELIVFSVSSIVYSTTVAMIKPFVMIYTSGVTDVNYDRTLFGIVLTIAGLFTCFRIPYYMITTAVGHYKQTRNGAFIEAGLNIFFSVIFVVKMGIVGVAIGTLIAAAFRSVQYAVYLGKNILNRSISYFVLHVAVSLLICAIIYFMGTILPMYDTTIMGWIIKSILLMITAIILVIISDFIIWHKDSKNLIKKVKGIFAKKREKVK